MTQTSLSKLLIFTGTIGTAFVQWFIVLIIARSYGVGAVADYTTVLSWSTPIFVAAFLSLRDIYLSFQVKLKWTSLVVLRMSMLAAGSSILYFVALAFDWDIRIVLAFALLKSLDGVLDLTYARIQRQQLSMKLGLLMSINAALSLILICIGSIFFDATYALILCSALSSLVTVGLSVIGWHKDENHSEAQGLIKGGFFNAALPVTLAQLVSSLLVYSPVFLIQLANSPQALGRYSVISYLAVFGNLVGTSLSTLLIAQYRSAFEASGYVDLRKKSHLLIRKTIVIGLLASAVVVAFGNPVLGLLYGDAFTVPLMALVLCSLAAVLAPLGSIINITLLVSNTYKAQPIVTGLAVIASFVGGLCGLLLGLSPLISGCLALFTGSCFRFLGFRYLSRKIA